MAVELYAILLQVPQCFAEFGPRVGSQGHDGPIGCVSPQLGEPLDGRLGLPLGGHGVAKFHRGWELLARKESAAWSW